METGFADHSIGTTYRRLRYLISSALCGLPLLTAAAGYWVGGHSLQPSLSDYYFVVADGGTPRTLFIFFLAFLGASLIAYKGLDGKDDLIHNLAGLFALGVAIFPMKCVEGQHVSCVPGWMPYLHLPSAGLLYLSALASVIYSGGPKLGNALNQLPETKKWLSKLNRIKFLSAGLMTIGIFIFFAHSFHPKFKPDISWIFWIEYLGFFGFGLYWFRFMLFINAANEEGRKLTQTVNQQDTKHLDLELASRSTPREQPGPVNVTQWKDIP